MKLCKCESGHFYDGDKYPLCPYCNTDLQQGGSIVAAAGEETPAPAQEAPAAPDGPVAGWLVVLTGPRAGQDYRLGQGRSFFGLDEAGQPTPLGADAPLSRRLLTVAYDPETGAFSALPGSGQELAYVNGKANLAQQPLAAGDEVRLGGQKLRFVPFCGEFRWPPRQE